MQKNPIIQKRELLFSCQQFISIVALCSAFLAVRNYAQVPKSESEIPLFPGATRDVNAEAAKAKELASASSKGIPPMPIISSSLKVYSVRSSIEEVVRFYRKRLGDKQGETETTARHNVFFHDFDPERFKCPFGEVDYTEEDVARVKAAMTKGRPPFQPDKWVSDANWEWGGQNAEGKPLTFNVSLTDIGLSSDCKTWSPKTEIAVQVSVHERPEEAHALSLPTEGQLGVPVYPGAQFDAEHSQFSPEEGSNYVFLSNDPVEKVRQFYENKTGKKATSQPDGSRVIVLKGNLEMPEHAVMIMPNTMLGGSAKTVITISKQTGQMQKE